MEDFPSPPLEVYQWRGWVGGGSETEQGPERDSWKTGSVISEEGQVSIGEVGGLGPTWGLLWQGHRGRALAADWVPPLLGLSFTAVQWV